MNIKEAKQFVKDWTGRGKENQDYAKFWIQLLSKVFEDQDWNNDIDLQQEVQKLDKGNYYEDIVIFGKTNHSVLVEQKGMNCKLDAKYKRHGKELTPYEQALEYDNGNGRLKKVRWIIACNFQEFWIYDMNLDQGVRNKRVHKIKLSELTKYSESLDQILDPKVIAKLEEEEKEGKVETPDFTKEEEISVKAGELVGILYDELRENYKNPDDPETLRQLNILCVRIVFCLYAEDAGLFDKNNTHMFYDYLAQFKPNGMREALKKLFKVLNQKEDERDPYLGSDDPLLASFPYVNGGLFEEEVEIPPFTDKTRDILLNKESAGFDWSEISPTIFGAVFESTLNQDTRRKGGMHYTSLENIHKVIDPLFLDDLKKELKKDKSYNSKNDRQKHLEEFQIKLSQLKFFDPACGSGNFLTESYKSIRELENEALKELIGPQLTFDFGREDLSPIKVSIQQFYGIEINDFAVEVARTAMWIAEAQMFEKTKKIFEDNKKRFVGDFLPLKTFTNIHEGNALRMNWDSVIEKSPDNLYIFGNPPFVGARLMEQNGSQKKDIQAVFSELGKNEVKDLDYVSGWYKKAAEFIAGTQNKCAFVSTSSITQGQQVSVLFGTLMKEYQIHIDFAYCPFPWKNEATDQATVSCVIISFSTSESKKSSKKLYNSDGTITDCKNISPYLINMPDCIVTTREHPITPDIIEARSGNMPRTKLFTIKNDQEKDEILKKEPDLKKWIRPYIGADEFLKRKHRYCFWLKGITPREIQKSKILHSLVKEVEQIRSDSKAKTTQGYAKTPWLFAQITQPDDVDYLLIPRHTSGVRDYIPMGMMSSYYISSDACEIIPGADLYYFGIMQSNVHMAWMKTVCGRLGEGYRYSVKLVYNNFPWPDATKAQKEKIKQTAQQIINVRKEYMDANKDTSLANMYSDMTLYEKLKDAHEANNRAVMKAYGFDQNLSEPEIIEKLMKKYKKLVSRNSLNDISSD